MRALRGMTQGSDCNVGARHAVPACPTHLNLCGASNRPCQEPDLHHGLLDHQAVGLPVEIDSFEVGKLGDAEAGVEKGTDDEFLFVGVAGVGQASRFISGK